MPNNVTNILTISGDENEIKNLIQKVKGTEETQHFSFNSIKPIPEELPETKSETLPNWYIWRCANWGTKWEAYRISQWISDKESTTITFETAWSTPFKALLRLSELFPTLIIECKFADEDTGSNLGYYALKNGNLVSETVFPYSQESVKVAESIYEEAELIYAI